MTLGRPKVYAGTTATTSPRLISKITSSTFFLYEPIADSEVLRNDLQDVLINFAGARIDNISYRISPNKNPYANMFYGRVAISRKVRVH